MKFIISFFLTLFLSFNLFASNDRELIIKFDHNNSNYSNLEKFIKNHQENNRKSRIVFEFYDSNAAFFFKTANKDLNKSKKEIYQKTYPNGDFYYLIGDLGDNWTKSDYEKYYSVAKWLSLRGFRTILNVAAYEPDLQEAVSNENTTAIIWNSHGRKDGTILDTNKVAIDEQLFVNLRSPNLRYVLFANCWGDTSAQKYGLRNMEKIVSEGWDRTVTSDDLFKYIFSSNFDKSLSKAIGRDITNKSSLKIDI